MTFIGGLILSAGWTPLVFPRGGGKGWAGEQYCTGGGPDRPPVLLETFVDQGRFRGTSYQAANWKLLGITQGCGKKGGKKPRLPLKSIYLYLLTKDFRLILTGRKNPH